jgi:hypothetical protein
MTDGSHSPPTASSSATSWSLLISQRRSR